MGGVMRVTLKSDKKASLLAHIWLSLLRNRYKKVWGSFLAHPVLICQLL